jgi:hypothetical protein
MMGEMAERLIHAAATAANDDYSKPGTIERSRSTSRINTMLEAADELTALRAENERLRAALGQIVGETYQDNVGDAWPTRGSDIARAALTKGE